MLSKKTSKLVNKRTASTGLVIVYTGDGKGKTTASLGLAVRALGYNLNVLMLQFIKGSWFYGELEGAKRLAPNFSIVSLGKGFVGIIDDNKPLSEHQHAAREALKEAKGRMLSGKYDILILDEINYATSMNLISVKEVLDLIRSKPRKTTLVLTGNNVDQQVIEVADLVTEMKSIKHPFEKGMSARRGIDF
ncbi:MAG: cob(I)yrinic acid a,c-diamide adenosyltransferase [Thaumarchaeota archaeon]|nr:cob(I)yrinic acid a,c-diamide adenosyltransferase [Nitrososphaerota archaeon]